MNEMKFTRKESARLREHLEKKICRRTYGCWEWYGAWNHGPIVSIRGRHGNVRRLLYKLYRGDPGPGRLERICNSPDCVNPEHMTKTKSLKGGRKSFV
jgi:hypothetical protein